MARKKNKADQQRRRQAKVQARQKRRAAENARWADRGEPAGDQSGDQSGGQSDHQASHQDNQDVAHPLASERADAEPVFSPSDTWEATDSLRLASAVGDRLEVEVEAEADESNFEEALFAMLELIADGLLAAIQRTVDEPTASPARDYMHRLVETDSDAAAEDAAAEGLGLSFAVRILLDWLRVARTELETTPLADELLAWVETNLGPDLAALAKQAARLLENAEMDPDERIELVDNLGMDLLPALIWLVAGLVATQANHEATWLRRYDDQVLRQGLSDRR